MTLTPAIKEALDKYGYGDDERGRSYILEQFEMDALLSVVAAEEGRKYAELVKLHREWVEAQSAYDAQYGDDREIHERLERAKKALAQWEAK